MTGDPDIELLDKIVAGDTSAYSDLIDRYKRYVFSICLRIIISRGEAEEAAQDAFIKAFHGLRNFNRDSKFSTWLYRIAFNTAISYKRRLRQDHFDIATTVISTGAESESSIEKSDKKRFVHAALEKLSEADRSVLSLFYLQEFSLEEIAEITGTPSNTIKVRIHRARQRMADELTTILKHEALTL